MADKDPENEASAESTKCGERDRLRVIQVRGSVSSIDVLRGVACEDVMFRALIR